MLSDDAIAGFTVGADVPVQVSGPAAIEVKTPIGPPPNILQHKISRFIVKNPEDPPHRETRPDPGPPGAVRSTPSIARTPGFTQSTRSSPPCSPPSPATACGSWATTARRR